ncbi:MAG: chemotaxis protein CheC [Desulfuromonadales bacterium]|nr:chemotaxis protein CheC [Desulfuromonadales bacterium]
MSLHRLTADQLQSLREVHSFGAAQAAAALAQLLGEAVSLPRSQVTVIDIARLPARLGGGGPVSAGIALHLLGDARGAVLLLLTPESVGKLLGRRLGHADMLLDELGSSTLKEMGNILACSYFNTLGGRMGLTLRPSVPQLSCGAVEAVIAPLVSRESRCEEGALLAEAEFHTLREEAGAIRARFLFLPAAISVHHFLQALGRAEKK